MTANLSELYAAMMDQPRLTPLAGANALVDMITFRELYGFLTVEKKAELDALKAEGIAARDMQTSGLTLYPVFDNRPAPDGQGGAPRIEGYRASNTITVRVRDLPRLGLCWIRWCRPGRMSFAVWNSV